MGTLPRFVVVSGKGGVGKSAVAAAVALAVHRRGGRVLAIAMSGDGGGLAAHLGAPPLQFPLREERPGLFTSVIERSEALREYLHLQVGLPQIVAFGPAVRAFDSLASTAPAIREIVTMGKILWEVKRGDWDLVVADGPPTGQIGSYLRAARTISELVPSGRIREQAAWMQAALTDTGAAELVLVTLPEELPTAETIEALDWVDEEQVIDARRVVTNRVLAALEWDGGTLPSGKAGEAAQLHLSLTAEQSRWLEALPPDHALPFLFGTMTPTEVAVRLADEIEEWA
jgi:anion-transporting  ArsA/GET3 family ATPase